jgi:hypothetical protein
MSLVGKKVKVEFNTHTWPVQFGTYTYEGHDETGHWVRRKDGVQRHFEFGDVVGITPIGDDAEEITEDY